MKIAGVDPSINATGVYLMELDDKLNIINQDYMGFTQVKKNSSGFIHHYRKKDFKDNIEQNIWMQDKIFSFVDICDYIAIENYAFNATGMLFNIGEFVGGLKLMLYRDYSLMRLYEPTIVKMYATGKGNADKIRMIDEYDKYNDNQINLSTLPQYKTPKEDIVDSYYICKLLRLELMLRKGLITLDKLSETEIKIFNRCTKSNPENLLIRNFLGE